MHLLCSLPELISFLFSPNGALALGNGAGVGAGERRFAADLLGEGMEMTGGSLLFPGCQLKSIFGWQQTKVYI